jgi:hypothetical protein
MKLESSSGRIFYVNHTLKAISWEPPLPPTPSSTPKSAALDQLSERTKALGAKLRDEMKIEAKQTTTTNLKGASGTGSSATSHCPIHHGKASSLLDAKKDAGKAGKENEPSSSTAAGLASASLAADLSRFSISSPR